MTEKDYLSLLIKGVEVAQSRGVYNLESAKNLSFAVDGAKARIEEIKKEEANKTDGKGPGKKS